MTDKDTITLPRELAEKALEALEHFKLVFGGYSEEVKALRTHLAAEQPKHDLMKWAKDAGSSPEDLERFATYTIATRDMEIATLREENEALRRDAEQPKHPGYVIGSHWLETAYSRVCAGEAEADVLRDCGWERVDDAEALRRDAEKWRKARAKYIAWQKGGKAEAMEGT